MLTFQENFWGEDYRGFGILLKRLKFGRTTTEALINFITARIEIEEEYNKKLQRLGAFQFPREEQFFGEGGKRKGSKGVGDGTSATFELVQALLSLPQQTAELASRQATLIDSLKQRLLWPLEHGLKEQRAVKNQHKQEMVRIAKAKTGQQEYVAALKERYFTRCKEKALLVDANLAGVSGRALEKHEQRLKRAKEAEQEADAEYRSNIYKLAELHNSWVSRMNISAQEFQKLEETRLALTKHVLLEYSVINHCHMQEQAIAYDQLRDRASFCDGTQEIQEFIGKYRTGTTVPTSLAYAHFNNESIEESLQRLAIRSTHSPRRLYASTAFPPTTNFSSASLLPPPPPPPSSTSSTSSASSFSSRSIHEDIIAVSLPQPLGIIENQKVPDFSNRSTPLGSDTSRSVSLNRYSRGSVCSTTATPLSSTTNNSLASRLSAAIASSALSDKGLFKVRALYSYEAQQPDEISFKEGDILRVVSTECDPWWSGQLNSSPSSPICLFPSNYVERI